MVLRKMWNKFVDWVYFKLDRCVYCHYKKAVWHYMPATDRLLQACSDCVPRGCSCNMIPIDGDYENEDPKNWVEEEDEHGRKYPCCEWWY